MKRRRSPIHHRVKTYMRNGKSVKEHTRGKGQRDKQKSPRRRRVKNREVKSAFAQIKRRLGWIHDVLIVRQKDLKGKLISELQSWDVTGLKVHGYIRKLKAIIVPDEPSAHEVIHEYGHYLYDITPSMARVDIPVSYPVTTEHGRAEHYNVFHGSNDEWFAYHFAFWVAGDTDSWHEIEKEKFSEMLKKVKKRRAQMTKKKQKIIITSKSAGFREGGRTSGFTKGEEVEVIRILPNGDAVVWTKASPSVWGELAHKRKPAKRRKVQIPSYKFELVK